MEAVRLFACKKPVVGAIQGAAIGGGFGLSLVPDFRVGCSESRFAANFTRLGFHPGFGLTATLPRVIYKRSKCPWDPPWMMLLTYMTPTIIIAIIAIITTDL